MKGKTQLHYPLQVSVGRVGQRFTQPWPGSGPPER